MVQAPIARWDIWENIKYEMCEALKQELVFIHLDTVESYYSIQTVCTVNTFPESIWSICAQTAQACTCAYWDTTNVLDLVFQDVLQDLYFILGTLDLPSWYRIPKESMIHDVAVIGNEETLKSLVFFWVSVMVYGF